MTTIPHAPEGVNSTPMLNVPAWASSFDVIQQRVEDRTRLLAFDQDFGELTLTGSNDAVHIGLSEHREVALVAGVLIAGTPRHIVMLETMDHAFTLTLDEADEIATALAAAVKAARA